MKVRPYVLAALGAFATLLFALTLSRNYLPDGIQFALVLEEGNPRALWQPNHLLFPQVALAFRWLWGAFGYQGRTLLPLQVLDVLAGGVGVGLMCAIAARATGSSRAGAVAAVGLMVSQGYWLYASDAEVVLLPLAISLLSLWIIVAHLYPQPRPLNAGSWVALTANSILGILLLQTGVFVVLPAALGLWAARGGGPPWSPSVKARPALSVTLFLLVTATVVGGTYGLVRAEVFGERGLAGLLSWPGQYALPRSFRFSQLAQGMYAALRALAGFYPLRGDVHTVDFLASARALPQVAFVAMYVFTGATVAGALFLAWKSRVTLLARHRAMLGMLALWAAGYGLFALYWQPGDVQFWSPVLIPFWLLTALAFKAQTRWRGAISLIVAALAISNFLQVAVPNTFASRNLPLQAARAIEARTTRADLIVTSGGDALFLYIPYFASRQTLAFSTLVLQAPGRQVSAALSRMRELVASTRAGGGRVYLAGVGRGGTTRWADLQSFGIRPEDFSALSTRPAWDAAGVEVVEVLP